MEFTSGSEQGKHPRQNQDNLTTDEVDGDHIGSPNPLVSKVNNQKTSHNLAETGNELDL